MKSLIIVEYDNGTEITCDWFVGQDNNSYDDFEKQAKEYITKKLEYPLEDIIGVYPVDKNIIKEVYQSYK